MTAHAPTHDLVVRNARGILTGLRGAAERRTGDLRIRDGRIAQIGDVPALPGDRVLDARGGVVTPGLISTHHHLFQSMLKGVPSAIDAPLETWLRLVPTSYWNRLDEDALQTAALVGMAELLLSGCTTVADHHYLFADSYRYDPAAVLFETADRLGLRLVLARGGTTRTRAFDTDDILPTPTEPLDVMLRRVGDLVSRYHDPSPDSRRRIVIAPNTPTWGVTPDELRELAHAARAMGIGLHSHLSETGNYVRYCREIHNMRPVQFVAEHGWTGPDVWFAHLVHLDHSEIAILAETGTGMAHCPQSNCRLGSGIAPAPDLDRLGGRVSLAVDGAASNEACDMAAEMHCAWMVHRATHGAAAIRCEDVLRWSTAGGARVLGLPDLGTVAEGQVADLVVHGLDQPRHAGLFDPLIAPVASGAGSVRHVLSAGRPVVVDGAIPGLDLPALLRHARAVVTRIARQEDLVC
ncbi:amidohydrolase family protein [Nguyenibacter sp. L1]|uniref:amidohydrolase family protein n=1 Tax=Nguyenibacter sp. L1 TaxID=3049350 RepID=UPI002B49FEF8|nr:amidohydrolase family protein [Nguyenibacter sp. L1]WRH88767.1 amidohydrolase family protein [Nguyenibacter sp. L1]